MCNQCDCKAKFCKCGNRLEIVKADEPWHSEYYICPYCESTYCKDFVRTPLSEAIDSAFQLNKIKIKELDKLDKKEK